MIPSCACRSALNFFFFDSVVCVPQRKAIEDSGDMKSKHRRAMRRGDQREMDKELVRLADENLNLEAEPKVIELHVVKRWLQVHVQSAAVVF